MNKKECRQQARSRLASLSDADVQGRGESFAQALGQRPEYRQAGTVFCYLSVGREPDTFAFLRMALQDEKRVCAPVCIGKGVMRARQLSNLDKLEEGQYGIPVPPEGENWVEPEEIDFAVIPCVSCDREGHRLGQGGGLLRHRNGHVSAADGRRIRPAPGCRPHRIGNRPRPPPAGLPRPERAG